MSKFFVLLLGMSIFADFSFAQSRFELKGAVADENGKPVAEASVVLHPVKRDTMTNFKGNFVIGSLLAGKYAIKISCIGYQTLVDTITISDNTTYNVQLGFVSFSLQEVVVVDSHTKTRKKEAALNIEIVNNEYLKQNMGGSLMNSLERLPGISTVNIGSGQSKPVIRGLGFNRVVVVENGIKHEAQQWGSDHGLEIDQYGVENIEIVKGAASLEYGPEAIGGVIDVKNTKIPAVNSFGGTIDLTGKTNNDFVGGSVSLYGRKGWFFTDFRATILDYGDYKVPADSVDIYSYRTALYKNHLRNTAGEEADFHFSFGIINDLFQSKFLISNVYTKSGFFANAHGLEPRNVDSEVYDKSSRDILYPFQAVNHFKITNSSHYQWELLRIESHLGYQRNFRQEWSQYVSHGYMPAVFPDTLAFDSNLEREFDKEVYAGNIKLFWQTDTKTRFHFGINSEYQRNQINGGGFIIPTYRWFNLGGYALGKYSITNNSTLQLGVRYDYGKIKTSEYNDWFLSPAIENGDTVLQYLQRGSNVNRNFSNFTWSAGYNYNHKKWLCKINVGKSFRMPIAKELAANGVNYHHFSYEVGNSDLSPEVSYQLDVGVEFASQRFVFGAMPFINYFSNYIYLNPTSEHDRLYGNGNQVFHYAESKIFRYGTEIHAHYQLMKSIQIGVVGEYVYSEQLSGDKKGYTLPFSSPASAIFNIKYQKHKIKHIENPYVSVDYRLVAAQTNIVPPEEITNGYNIFNIGLGGTLTIGNQKFEVNMQVQNLMNTKYFNHTSYYRLINVPEPGRNMVINISVPFSGNFKKTIKNFYDEF